MNVFEDLIEELKEEDLLEDTVIKRELEGDEYPDAVEEEGIPDVKQAELVEDPPELDTAEKLAEVPLELDTAEELVEDPLELDTAEELVEDPLELDTVERFVEDPQEGDTAESPVESDSDAMKTVENRKDGDPVAAEEVSNDIDKDQANAVTEEREGVQPDEKPLAANVPPSPGQSLIDEVNNLEFVELVLTGVAREKQKKSQKPYDSVSVKQKLHQFLAECQRGNDEASDELKNALVEEIEEWRMELLERDDSIPTPLLRLYAENHRLSSKALVHLARFYRNSPFAENARSKFDFVITGLFTEESDDERRLLMKREEIVDRLHELYKEWKSAASYPEDTDDPDLVLAAFKFEDFISEAKACKRFDELINSNFFNRLKGFKKRTKEGFYAPMLVASAIECNVVVGNKYVQLVGLEKKREKSEALHEQYGVHDKSVSDATSKTVKFVELLEKINPDDTAEKEPGLLGVLKRFKATFRDNSFGWFDYAKYGFIVIGILVSGYFAYTGFVGPAFEPSASEKKVRLERSFLHEYVRNAEIKDEKFVGQITPAWKELSVKKREEIVGKLYSIGKKKGFKSVNLKDETGKVVASTKGTKVEIVE